MRPSSEAMRTAEKAKFVHRPSCDPSATRFFCSRYSLLWQHYCPESRHVGIRGDLTGVSMHEIPPDPSSSSHLIIFSRLICDLLFAAFSHSVRSKTPSYFPSGACSQLLGRRRRLDLPTRAMNARFCPKDAWVGLFDCPLPMSRCSREAY
jgi:hypothetical protein